MKAFKALLIFGISALLMADGKTLSTKCAVCHGVSFEKAALGKSSIVKGQSSSAIEASLKGYKTGTLNKNGMGALMKGQVASLSDADIKIISAYVASIGGSK